MSAAAASGAAAAAGAPPPRGDEELDDGPTEWCPMPLGFKRYLLSRGVGTREPRKYSEITHPGSGNLTEKGHAYSVMMSALTKRCCICDRAMKTARKHPFTGESGFGEGCKCGPLLELIGASQRAGPARPARSARPASSRARDG
jgi:hypothetical protein